MKRTMAVAVTGLIGSVVSAATWHVPADGGLQAVINAAQTDDVIIVSNGDYSPISTGNKSITIRSVNGAGATIIDGGGMSRCATLGEWNGKNEPITNTVLVGFTLRNGNALHGGGACYGTLNNCVLLGNVANDGGGASYSTLNGCTLLENSCSRSPGSNGGGAAICTLKNCIVTRNTAYYGGGVFGCTLDNCIITENCALFAGGGTDGSLLSNCLLIGNRVDCVVDSDGSDGMNHGGGARFSELVNCTLSANIAGGGGGVAYCWLCNSIAWGNTALRNPSPNYLNDFGIGNMEYSCVEPMPNDGTGNIAEKPCFMDAANGNFRLKAGSPCINAGTNKSEYLWVGELDLDGNQRIQNGTVDMGAYEFTGAVFTPTQDHSVPVPLEWLIPYRGWENVTDYGTLVSMSGANNLFFWESYVAGLNPTNAASRFSVTNLVVDTSTGITALNWTPHRDDRDYTVWGKTNLTDSAWHWPTNDATRFFKVRVAL